MANPFVGYDNIIPLIEPQDTTTADTVSPYMDLKNAHKASFLVIFGEITSTTVTDEIVITVEAASAEDGAEAAIDFRYRKSGALGANTWGDVTTVAAATGLGMGADDSDDMLVWVEVDPDALGANDYRYARLLLTVSPASQMEACLVSVLGILETRYKQTTHISATASASV